MKLTAQNVFGATVVLASIIKEQRSMPQRGKYLVARLHTKLLPEYNVLEGRRNAIVQELGDPVMKTEELADGTISITPVEGQWQVPMHRMPEFTKAWEAIGAEELEVDVQPLPLSALSLPTGDGAIEAHELVILGDLITE